MLMSLCSGQRGQDLHAVHAPSSEAFETGLDGALVNQSWWVITQPIGVWNQMNFGVPSNLSHSRFYDACVSPSPMLWHTEDILFLVWLIVDTFVLHKRSPTQSFFLLNYLLLTRVLLRL